jgi:hypothetical protein
MAALVGGYQQVLLAENSVLNRIFAPLAEVNGFWNLWTGMPLDIMTPPNASVWIRKAFAAILKSTRSIVGASFFG